MKGARKLAQALAARPWLRPVGLNLVIGIGIALLAAVSNHHFPLRHWLSWSYLSAWAWALLFAASAAAAGLRLGRRFGLAARPLGERLLLSFALGVVLFALGVFAGGLVGLYGGFFFVGWPAALLAFGGGDALELAGQIWRHRQRFGFALLRPRGALETVAAAFALLALCAVYLHVITPRAIGPDAHAIHLAIAEHHAAAGRLAPFSEGWFPGARPQLASWLYTWAFQGPGDLFAHVVAATHLEWLLFLATFAGVPVLVRRLTGARLPWAGTALFAFPAIFVFDSHLGAGHEHVLGFFIVPWVLALLQLVRRFEPVPAVLFAVFTAAGLLTGYEGVYLLVPAVVVVLALALARRRLQPALVFLGAVALGASPHWLRNLVVHADPFYPALQRFVPSQPLTPRAAGIFAADFTLSSFPRTTPFGDRLADTLRALFTFSFVPADADAVYRTRPVFGSLFTLLLLPLALVRPPRRIWLLVLALHLAVAVWFSTPHHDRGLAALMPLMAALAVTAAVLLWRERLVRVPVALLFAYQVLACADIYFFRHPLIGEAPWKATVDLFGAGYRREFAPRRQLAGGLEQIGKTLAAEAPAGARVLLHETRARLGLGAPVVMDAVEQQGAIDYLGARTAEELAAIWRRHGVTHLVRQPRRPGLSVADLAREAAFMMTFALTAGPEKDHGGFGLARLQAVPAASVARARARLTLAVVGCGEDPAAGLYTPSGLVDGRPDRRFGEVELASDPTQALAGAQAVIFRPGCRGHEAVQAELQRGFNPATTSDDRVLWVRKLP